MSPIVRTMPSTGGGRILWRVFEVGDARLPVSTLELSILRAALERARREGDAAELAAKLSTNTLRSVVTPDRVKMIAGGLLHFLLTGEQASDAPTIARWRARVLALDRAPAGMPAPAAVAPVEAGDVHAPPLDPPRLAGPPPALLSIRERRTRFRDGVRRRGDAPAAWVQHQQDVADALVRIARRVRGNETTARSTEPSSTAEREPTMANRIPTNPQIPTDSWPSTTERAPADIPVREAPKGSPGIPRFVPPPRPENSPPIPDALPSGPSPYVKRSTQPSGAKGR